ncbi:armadillo-type protein [Cunninghamella echinulata]|nr:armadillo-type protein [Cunninghamella echinulata]
MTDQSLSPNNQNTSSSSTSTNGSSLSTIDLEAAAPVATIPSQVFSFALIELLLDQKTVISSLALQSTISIASSILASAENDDEDNDEDEDAGDHHQQYCISLLDQEIVQGIILELYNIIKGKRKRHSKLYRFVPISSQQNNDDDGDGSIQSIDLGEIHLSKVACLSLISALVQYVGPLRCEKTCLPIIEDLSNDALFYVRREAAIALGSIAHYIHPSTIIERLVPLYYLFARDATSHVRNATILTLPILCELLPYEEKSRLAVDSVALFMKDADYNVRFTLAEIIGEVIAKFLPDDWEITGQPGNVPEPIIKFFLSLGDNSSHQPTQESIENQCSLLCAYNFPAVVLTAGASYWDTHFKEKYMKLAKDHQIKVRSSFAHSLHVIARIIGPNRTERDLIHIFALYVLDVDEIKRGILEHLADFLSILGVEKRLEYLPVLTEIWESVVTNRTLRGILVSQLASIVPLTTTLDQILDHILPLVISGCQDEIASIRETSTQVFSIIVQHFKHDASNFETWMTHLTKELTTFTLPSSNYRQRQVFSNACYNMLTNGLPYEEFIKYLLPKILPLANDPVTNVRIAVSKCLGALYYKVLVLDQQLHYQDLYDTVKKLATDKDQDVRHFVEGMITTTKSSPIIPQQQQQQQQIGDLLSELPSPPTSPVK